MTFDYTIFCKNLERLRKERGYNKLELSIQANIEYSYYCNIENGVDIPNFKNVIGIANALKIDIIPLITRYEQSDVNELILYDIGFKLKKITDRKLLEKHYEYMLSIKRQAEKQND